MDTVNVLLLSDPGLPTQRVDSARTRIRQHLTDVIGHSVTMYFRSQLIVLQQDNTLDLRRSSIVSDEDGDVDVTIVLTEVPRHSRGRPLVAEAMTEERVAVISCPTLGPWATRRRIVAVVAECVQQLIEESGSHDHPSLRWSRWSTTASGRRVLYATSAVGMPRTVAGMTVANDPWRTIPKLSSALAAAGAVGMFGVFYSSIWQMSSYLSEGRMSLIAVLAIAAMVAWLIFSNQLWDKPRQERVATVVLLYNLSTVLTLVLCVLALYVVLFALILVAGLTVIDPAFLGMKIGSPSGLSDYVNLAWLSASLGVVAGGLGASFDSGTDLRKLTHGQRERQRRFTAES